MNSTINLNDQIVIEDNLQKNDSSLILVNFSEAISENQTVSFIERKTTEELTAKFTKMLILFFGFLSVLSLVAIIGLDTVGMSGGPVLVTFNHYLTLMGITLGSGLTAGALKFVS